MLQRTKEMFTIDFPYDDLKVEGNCQRNKRIWNLKALKGKLSEEIKCNGANLGSSVG